MGIGLTDSSDTCMIERYLTWKMVLLLLFHQYLSKLKHKCVVYYRPDFDEHLLWCKMAFNTAFNVINRNFGVILEINRIIGYISLKGSDSALRFRNQ